jgi:uncharacterized membrane protein YphA (DoxX/SURF4 family)
MPIAESFQYSPHCSLPCCWPSGSIGDFSLPRQAGASFTAWPRIMAFFASLNIPFPGFTAPFIAMLEFTGGILLMLGLFSRPIAFLLACNMFAAYWTADHEALVSIFSDPGKFYVADPYTFLFASLMVLILGAGLYSVDTVVARYLRRRSNACLGGCVPQTDKRVGAEFLAR